MIVKFRTRKTLVQEDIEQLNQIELFRSFQAFSFKQNLTKRLKRGKNLALVGINSIPLSSDGRVLNLAITLNKSNWTSVELTQSSVRIGKHTCGRRKGHWLSFNTILS